MTSRPTALPVRPANIPDALKSLRCWLCWRYTWVPAQERWTKVPIGPLSSKPVAPDSGEGQANFDEALDTYTRSLQRGPEQRLDGIGLALRGTGLVALDVDDCVNEAGELNKPAAGLVAAFGSYAELSPRARGLRILLWGLLPAGRRKTKHPFPIEFFSENYVTLTGHVIGDVAAIARKQRKLDALYTGLFGTAQASEPTTSLVPASPTAPADQELLARARAAQNGTLFDQLWRGEWQGRFPSQSEADLALASILAFWCQGDADRIDHLFRQSALYRPKWDREAYRVSTINLAIANCSRFFAPPSTELVVRQPEEPKEHSDDPFRLARAILGNYQDADRPTLRWWRDEWYRWTAGAYRVVPDSDLEAECYLVARQEYERLYHLALAHRRQKGESTKDLKVQRVTQTAVNTALQALASLVHLPGQTEPPCWLDEEKPYPPHEVLACPNGLVHLPSVAAGKVGFHPATPNFFSQSALDFNYDPDAPEPVEWLRFLSEVWPDDPDTIDTLQEWFGYCISPDTSQHKMFLLVGPKRSGKGTIAAVLTRLVGELNVAGPTLASFSERFGLQGLLGKTLAIVDDARLSGRSDSAVVAERLLSISGEGRLLVDRKNLPPVSTKLGVRLMVLTNELPWLPDNSGVLPSRFIVSRMTRSWYGQEDTKLRERLFRELPGILRHFAIPGWQRLQERGRFVQPGSGEQLLEHLENVSSPVAAFVREICVVEPGARAWKDELWEAWQRWCNEEHREPGTKAVFCKNLLSVVPHLRQPHPRKDGKRLPRAYEGIRIDTAKDR